ncbi:MAG TPA: PA2779 family protein [Burkholderiales bacterium]|nr:PA2779 family protein [Burkholderiales bacterium]
MTIRTHRLITALLLVSVLGVSLPIPAHAASISTDAALALSERERILSVLDRAEVRAQLAARGVSPSDVKARIAALTDEEAAELASRMDELPAGGILGAIVLVFLVLLLTDILGYTKIFPFTKPINK